MRRIMVWLLAAGVAPAATLESDRLRVLFDDTHGAITSFVDKTTGQEFVSPESSGLYGLTLWDAAHTRTSFTERDATASVTSRGRTVVISANHADRKISVRVECTLTGPALACKIAVKNASPLAIYAVRFPAVEFPLHLGANADDDRLLLPRCDGAILENPEANLKGSSMSNYPGAASVQMLAYYDATAGIRATALDGAGYRKALGVERHPAAFGLQMMHYPEIAPGHDFTVPYPVELALFHGDWESAAADYRKWAVRQTWCKRRLDQRLAELPSWLRQMPFFYTIAVRGMNAGDKPVLRYATVGDQSEVYAKLLGSPVTALVMSWEKQGPWVTPDYFPAVGGDEAFQALMTRLKAAGNRSMIFFSGLKWTLRKGTDYDSTEVFARDGEAAAIVADTGKTLIIGKPGDDTGQYAELCPATRYAQDLLSRLSRHVTELGVTSVQMDQLVGGGDPPCFSEKHGHPIGGGKWQTEAVYRLLERLRSEGKARNPDFALSLEEPGEFFIPVLDTYHARDYAEGRWPRDGKGIRGIPLFTFIYHDYLLGYGGDSAGISKVVSPQNIYSAAANLINGKIAAAAVWTTYLEPGQVEPGQRDLLLSALALARGPAHDFLLFGERLPTPKLDVPEVTFPIYIQSSRSVEDRPFPAVVNALWKLPNGRVCWVAVNISGKPQDVIVPLRSHERVHLDPGATLFRQQFSEPRP